ncbi:hypothetical protein Tco_0230512 [Tanacetum coccineum]
MTRNRSKLKNFVEKLIGTVRFGNDHIGAIMGYGDYTGRTMALVRISSGPEPIMMTPGQLNSGLAPSTVPATTYISPTDKDL